VLVENLQENLKNGIPAVILFRLAINVEEYNLGLGVCHSPQIALKGAVASGLLNEEVEGHTIRFAVFRNRIIGQQVGQNLDEMGFA